MTAYINHNTTVYDLESDEEITLAENGDVPGTLYVKASGDYYGKIAFGMNLDVAEAFAKAILKQCEFIRNRDD